MFILALYRAAFCRVLDSVCEALPLCRTFCLPSRKAMVLQPAVVFFPVKNFVYRMEEMTINQYVL